MSQPTENQGDYRQAVTAFLEAKRAELNKSWMDIAADLGFSYRYFVQVKNGSNNRPMPRKFIREVERLYKATFDYSLGEFIETTPSNAAGRVVVVRITLPPGTELPPDMDVRVDVSHEIPQN